MKAKVISKYAKVISAVGLIVTSVLKMIGVIDIDTSDAAAIWALVYGLAAGTIDINIILDKLKEITATTAVTNASDSK